MQENSEDLMEVTNKILDKYELIQHQYLKDTGCDSLLLRHRKTGARVALLPSEDDNKVFYIGFRTPPEDSTGVAHILEHSVLCGSRDFPVKDPFIELAKGSLNTFLNAMTYPDKTVYPVASCNDTDFKNLMHVYLDAVFHPNIYSEQNIFRQEGWHYEAENEDSPITVNGVVYNEMKGALSSPDDVLARSIYEALYPHTPYAVESGGDPVNIPDLTYEAFLNFHSRYYHPSNSYIFLYGNMDMEERLAYLDEAYLSTFDKLAIDSEIPAEPAFDKPVEAEQHYSVLTEEEVPGRSFLSWNVSLAPDGQDTTICLAFRILDYMLCDAEGAPVKKALRDKGIGEDVFSMLELGVRQPTYSVVSKYTDPEKKEEFISTIEDTLREIAEKGLDQRALLAGINRFEFKYREANYGFYPKGLVYGINALDTWLYNEDAPFINLELGEAFAFLRKQMDQGYFEALLRKHFLENPHKAVVVMTPEPGLTEKMAEELRQKLGKFEQGLTAEERQKIFDDLAALRKWQETPSAKEDVEKIPMLRREDLSRETKPFVNRFMKAGSRVVSAQAPAAGSGNAVPETLIVAHPLNTSGIDYLTCMFDISRIPQRFFPYLGIFKTLLGVLDTERYGYAELDQEINIHTGGMGSAVSVYTQYNDTDKYRMMMEVNCKVLHENFAEAMRLVTEILTSTKWDSKDRILEVLEEERAAMRADLPASGHATAAVRATACFSETSLIMDCINGVNAYHKLDEVCGLLEKGEAGDILTTLAEMAAYIFRADHLMIDCTADEECLPVIAEKSAELAGSLPAACSPESDLEAYGPAFSLTPVKVKEAFTTAGQVQFVCRAGSFGKRGLPYTGALLVLRVILAYDYLWNRVRVTGGAYGCMSSFTKDGNAYFVSYRDPHLARTIKTFEEAPDYVRGFDADERTMTKYIIGAVSALDHPMTPPTYGKYSLTAYMTGLTEEYVQKERFEALDCGPEQIRALAAHIEAFLAEDCLCVVGNDEKLRSEADRFDRFENLK